MIPEKVRKGMADPKYVSQNTRYVDVSFDLPFLIAVNDGFTDSQLQEYVEARDRGEKPRKESSHQPLEYDLAELEPSRIAIIDVSGLSKDNVKYGVYLPTQLSDWYRVRITDNVIVGLSFLYRINQQSDPVYIGFPLGDSVGNIAFSTVLMRLNYNDLDNIKTLLESQIFDHDVINTNPKYSIYNQKKDFVNDANGDVYLALSEIVINKFIEKYKFINDVYFINNITKNVFRNVIIRWYDSLNDIIKELAILPVPILEFASQKVSSEADALLRASLIDNENLDIVKVLDLEIRGRLDRGEWRLAVVDSAVMFETWIHPKLVYHYRTERGMGKGKYDKMMSFNDADGKRHPLPISLILENIIPNVIGESFIDKTEAIDLKKNAIQLRNDIVHGNTHIINKQQAVNAYLSVRKAIEYLEAHFSRSKD
ncbi:hypothetical protein [Hymenobacter pini]|uniref:hypothetical protein n=1 Tax=Hymenobacter pini TaxID=2880879 RepID=UPI001CF1C66E|nr:hypothetical protein [Hymenobacter pini]MCA8830195.1 hypothetical protein [Hymenobacter pini]